MNTLQNQGISTTDILVIIDAQYGFIGYEHTRLIYNLVKYTKLFRDKGCHICIVSYADCGLVLSGITDELTYYKNKSHIVKHRTSAGPYILRQFSHLLPCGIKWHLIGVNWTQCLFQTAKDLVKAKQDVIVYKKASNPNHKRCPKIWEDLSINTNLTIVN